MCLKHSIMRHFYSIILITLSGYLIHGVYSNNINRKITGVSYSKEVSVLKYAYIRKLLHLFRPSIGSFETYRRLGFFFTWQVYTIVHEKAELLYYNDSIVTPDVVFSFRKVNKTDFAFNTTFTTTRDFLDRKIMIKLSADKLFAGEYKRTGTSFTANVCKFYEKNTFGCRDLLDRYSNFNLCDVRKGFYHMYNFIPDPKLFPKFIPYGSYRLVIHVFHQDSSSMFLMHWYARIEKIIKY